MAGGAAVKAVVWLIVAALATPARWLTVIDTLASIALAGGGIGFFVRAIAIARHRLLWRVRRKLVIASARRSRSTTSPAAAWGSEQRWMPPWVRRTRMSDR